MTDAVLDRNPFFQYLQNDSQQFLKKLKEPYWKICVPDECSLEGIVFTPEFVECQTLWKVAPSELYMSSLLEENLYFDIIGDENRTIIWNMEKDSSMFVSKARILNEYLITVKEHVVHVFLIDRPLPSMVEEDQAYMSHPLANVSTNQEAEDFLRSFLFHHPILKDISEEIRSKVATRLFDNDVNHIQSNLHALILGSWERLIRRHTVMLQADPIFQDLLFRALDFFIVGLCHNILWPTITDRCSTVDQMVDSRMNRLRSIDLYQLQLGLPEGFYTPLPTAIVEMVHLNARKSAIDRLNCIRGTIELVQAHAKETRATLKQFQDSDVDRQDVQIKENELLSLMVIVLVQSRCHSIVSNIYYMTHYVFSIGEENNPLWQSLHLLRRCLQLAMTIDIGGLTPDKVSMRKELSLQNLTQKDPVHAGIEESSRDSYSRSNPDMSAMHLHESRIISRRLPQTMSANNLEHTSLSSASKKYRIMDFLSGLPSTIRASFRRKQTEHKYSLGNASRQRLQHLD